MNRLRNTAAGLALAATVLGFAQPAKADQNATPPTAAYAAEIHAINPRLRESQRRDYAEALLENALRFNVDPTLMMAVITVESHWDAKAVSWCGAFGLGQLMPDTARAIGVNPRRPRGNMHGTASYLSRLFAAFSDADQTTQTREAIAGYNAGPAAVKKYGGIPPFAETRRYVKKVLGTWSVLKARMTQRLAENRTATERSRGFGTFEFGEMDVPIATMQIEALDVPSSDGPGTQNLAPGTTAATDTDSAR